MMARARCRGTWSYLAVIGEVTGIQGYDWKIERVKGKLTLYTMSAATVLISGRWTEHGDGQRLNELSHANIVG